MRSDLRSVGRIVLLAAALAVAVDAGLWILHLLEVPAPAEVRHAARAGIVGTGPPFWVASFVNEAAVLLLCTVVAALAWTSPADRTAQLVGLVAAAYLFAGVRAWYGAWPDGSLRTLQASGSWLLAGAASLPSWLFLAADPGRRRRSFPVVVGLVAALAAGSPRASSAGAPSCAG